LSPIRENNKILSSDSDENPCSPLDGITANNVAAWVTESKNGNVRAFELIYREFFQRLFLFCKRMTGETGAAEELVQETFIKAWQALPGFRAESGFYTWLRKIASRLIIDKFRLKQEKIWQNSIEFEESDYSSKLSSERHSLAQQMELEKLIALLPEGARTVLVLHDIEGYSHKEISEMLGIAEGTSKAQLSRAKVLLRNHFVASQLNTVHATINGG
jgi:RNA polymerase sigma-70 factor (ECF subfamily)